MSFQITKIDVRNFRSIRYLRLPSSPMTILVGKNDSGKSNLLRALNLFFEHNSNNATELNFDIDHNVFNEPNRRAKEISITLEINLPCSYHSTNGNYIVWSKKWRANGLIHNHYQGYRRVYNSNNPAHDNTIDIPARSHLHALLRNINFVYVPAIKDLEYFSKLRASIYNIIAEVADRNFRDSSQAFETAISDELEDLTGEIENSLGLRSRLALPQDLSHVFESLDFLSAGRDISLDARGDGIKARHIPLILKFMADKKQSLQVRGMPPHTFIWAYEEPENNLEFSSCIELADQFRGYLDAGISQIFVTTHSPVFYNLSPNHDGSSESISCHHVFRESDEDGTMSTQEPKDLDEHMGTITLLSPLMQDLEDQIRRRQEARELAEQIAASNRRKIFVEGASDKTLLTKAFGVYAPDHAADIDIETQENGGHSYVVDMLLAWRSMAKHDRNLKRAAGIVDRDNDAVRAANEWNCVHRNVESAKCFKLPTPLHIRPALQAGFRIPIVLETLYDREAWEWAEGRNFLTSRDKRNVIPTELSNRIVDGETTLDAHLSQEWEIFVRREFVQSGKGPMARYFAGRADTEFSSRFVVLREWVEEIVTYLFPE